MGNKQRAIWVRSRDGHFYTKFNGSQIKLGRDIEAARRKYIELTKTEPEEANDEVLVRSICNAAKLIAKYLSRKEADDLLDSVYEEEDV